MGEPALDFHVCHRGLYAAIETKAPGKKPTPRQMQTIRKVVESGGSVFVIDSIDGPDLADLIMWLAFPVVGHISSTARMLLGDPNEPDHDRPRNAEHPQ